MPKIAVLGAGVIGLTSAYSLKLHDENLDVTVFAENFTPFTTSDVAAGIFAVTEGPKGMRLTPHHLLRYPFSNSQKTNRELLFLCSFLLIFHP